MSEQLVIVGASVRAAAFSARRAGWMPLAADRFADVDLRSCCPAIRLADFPRELVPFFQGVDEGPWMYTGVLENHPHLVDQIVAERTLYGNAGEVLRLVRDPSALDVALRDEGLSFPEICTSPDDVPTDGTWLRKMVLSGGGAGIKFHRQERLPATPGKESYFQRYIEGTPCAAVYVAAGGQVSLLGITRQLVGTEWTGASRFCYSGSIGPLQPRDHVVDQFQRIGATLAERFHLVGLFGVDVVLDGDSVWTIEVNPRYTASVEILERTLRMDLIGAHIGACCDSRVPDPPGDKPGRFSGKAILFARRDHVILSTLVSYLLEQNAGAAWPQFADIPHAGTSIKRGDPILTVLIDGDDLASVDSRLQRHVARIEHSLA